MGCKDGNLFKSSWFMGGGGYWKQSSPFPNNPTVAQIRNHNEDAKEA